MPQIDSPTIMTMTMNRCERANETRRSIMTLRSPLVAVRELQEEAALRHDTLGLLEPLRDLGHTVLLCADRDRPLAESPRFDLDVHKRQVLGVVEHGRRRDDEHVARRL